jgi:hypothetical protein
MIVWPPKPVDSVLRSTVPIGYTIGLIRHGDWWTLTAFHGVNGWPAQFIGERRVGAEHLIPIAGAELRSQCEQHALDSAGRGRDADV